MKVSNGNNIQRIYQEQVKKVRKDESGDEFKKIMQTAAKPGETPKTSFHPPSGISGSNLVFTGSPVKQADPAETLRFAAEVVASEPEIRENRIAQLKMLIETGQYNVSPESVAEKLLQSGVVTKSWDA